MPGVGFCDLRAEYLALKDELDAAIAEVAASGRFILGPQVQEFEKEFASYLGVRFAIACANGTEAIALALLAAGLKPGDEVLAPANTCVPTIAGIRLAKCTPVLMDVSDRELLCDVTAARRVLTDRTRGIVPVHLYGSSCDGTALRRFSDECRLAMVEDCAQSHGAKFDGQMTGSFGHAAAFSFYPTKNLGALGDGGAIVTNDEAVAETVRALRVYGQNHLGRYSIEGWNSRLDELQAAILRVKLRHLDAHNAVRARIANRYSEAFADVDLQLPRHLDLSQPVHHLYPIRTTRRDDLRRHLANRGVETLVHYETPVHMHPAFRFLGYSEGDFPVSEEACKTLLSLPLHPAMSQSSIANVVLAVREFFQP